MPAVVRLLATIFLLAAPIASASQPAVKVYRVGYLSAASREASEPMNQALLRGLRERGWIEGHNLIVERRWAEGNNERLRPLAAELVQRKVDVIVASAEAATLAAQDATLGSPRFHLKLGLVALTLVLSALHDFVLGPRAGRPGAGPGAPARASWLARVNALVALAIVGPGLSLLRG